MTQTILAGGAAQGRAAGPTPVAAERKGVARRWASRLRPAHLLVVCVVVFNLVVLRAQRIAVPYKNDSAFHLQMVDTARRVFLAGDLPLSHWSGHLSLGSPLFVQYQSLSSIVAGAVSLAVPPTQVYSWSLYLGLALWPLCMYWTARLLRFDPWESAACAVIAPLLFSIRGRGFEDQAYTWLGYGLWSQLWAMWTLPLAIGFAWRYLTERRYLFGAVACLSATIALHYLMAYLAGLMLVVMSLLEPRELVRRIRRAALLGVASLLCTLWVTLPLLADAKWTALNELQVGQPVDDSYGASTALHWLVDGNMFDYNRFPIVTILVLIGLAYCAARIYRDTRARVVVALFVVSMLLFFGRPSFGLVLDLLPGNQNLLFQRYMAGVQLAGIVLAGVASVWLCRLGIAGARAVWPRAVRAASAARFRPLGGAVAVVLAIGVLYPAWHEVRDYAGLNASAIAAQESADTVQGRQVDSLLALIRARGGGRVYVGTEDNWGLTFDVGIVPLYTYLEGTPTEQVGVSLRTNSLMTDPELFFDPSKRADFELFGVSYLMMPSTLHPGVPARLVGRAGHYVLWSVGSASLFQVVDTRSSITADGTDLGISTEDLLRSNYDESILPTIAFAGAPAPKGTLAPGVHPTTPPGRVLSEHVDEALGTASATVDASRRAVVLFKMAFDPGWSVTVDGRPASTEMVFPALLGVEVTPGVHTVTFRYRGYGSYPILFGVALVTLLALGLGPVWWRRRRGAEPRATPTAATRRT